MKRDGGGRRPATCRRDPGGAQKPPEEPQPGGGYCRLCHGRFSSRRLRQAFGKVAVTGRSLEAQRRMDHVFFTDFQQLVGVAVRRDPRLPQFVCKACHAQFYKCRSVLKTFIQRVNVSPTAQSSAPPSRADDLDGVTPGTDLITSSPECLHNLLRWSHAHAGGCRHLPSLQRVLCTQYCGIVRAVWGCREGHDYVMQLDAERGTPGDDITQTHSGNGMDGTAECHAPGRPETPVPRPHPEIPPPQDRSPAPSPEPDATNEQDGASPQAEPVKEDGSDLSEGDSRSRADDGETGEGLSSGDSATPCTEGRIPPRKRRRKARKRVEPGERNKPGPKPNWKREIKREREELPTIYKCPYQGCTAVYRGADGMKKHIKEHHEEVRERPCPHPGCNKVFMIDRYLQRHVKMIHTEERNYICEQCGQAFKQRKHLSVHQMRHSGAKPLQCEVCGFQCRQRASLKYHMTKHKAESDLEFACDQCGKRFEKAHNLNVHMSMVHPLTQGPAKPPDTEPDTQSPARPPDTEPDTRSPTRPPDTEPDTPSGTAEEAMKPELAQQPPG